MFEIPLYFFNHPELLYEVLNSESGHSQPEKILFMKDFFQGLARRKFAFCSDLTKVMGKDASQTLQGRNHRDLYAILQYLLTSRGLNYSSYPKALIKFHGYEKSNRTPLEEHLVEAKQYVLNSKGVTTIHFTLAEEHLKRIEQYLGEVMNTYVSDFGDFQITFSVQSSATKTLAVDNNNLPIRDSDGRLVFRPGGHGALIGNLDSLKADMIFITNIDNIVPDRSKTEVARYKRILGGFLLTVRENIFTCLSDLTDHPDSHDVLDRAIRFCRNHLSIRFPKSFESWEYEKKFNVVYKKLNRPIRVCAMVKNTGEPGGGPYWVSESNGEESLQIIEKAQINPDSDLQQSILSSSTHFNPVDMVCCTRDVNGLEFNLFEYVDRESYFIVEKSLGGRSLKALELPGLWNGAMAGWTTLFVEAPEFTFNPVKTVNDLLRSQHQEYHDRGQS
jgi:hypothetical protein